MKHPGRVLLAAAIVAALGAGAWGVYCLVAVAIDEVSPGKVYRSGQPSAKELRAWVNRYHIRTIFNLRGDLTSPRVKKEANAVRDLPVEYLAFDLAAWKLPHKQTMLDLVDALDRAKPPILIHCQQGMDRSGVVAMLAAWAIGGQDYATARQQLYFPVYRDEDEPHVSDVIIQYEDYCDREHLAPGDWGRFKAWVHNHYQGRGTVEEPVGTQPTCGSAIYRGPQRGTSDTHPSGTHVTPRGQLQYSTGSPGLHAS